ncbi:MAG: hypothetical protein WDO73_01485 [Ignavibacteriota bacterium]
MFTATSQYDPGAEENGLNRFPKGASVTLVSSSGPRRVASTLYASADPAVSFDGVRILFAGKASTNTPWEIWEVSAAGGIPRKAIQCQTDCTHPLYLPDGRIVYSRANSAGSDIEVADGKGGTPQRLTLAPGRHVTQDVLHDGRILFKSNGELFTIYPDGTGVEALRCDHGPRRSGARQVVSGDVIFSAGRPSGGFHRCARNAERCRATEWGVDGADR